MSVIRVEKNNNYTMMNNHHFRNRSLSLKAKGVMSLMLSLPDDWDYTIKGLATLSKDGVDSVRSALKELEEQGYLTMKRVRNEQGHLTSTEYVLKEIPSAEKPILGNPISEKPISENPILENPTQLNTNITKYLGNKVLTKESTKNNIYSPVIDFLNAMAGTNYKSTTAKTQQLIKARLAEGFTLEDFETVIKKKCREWLDTDFAKYLRPETLFGTKFESYLNASEVRGMPRNSRQGGTDVADEAVEMLESMGL